MVLVQCVVFLVGFDVVSCDILIACPLSSWRMVGIWGICPVAVACRFHVAVINEIWS